MNTKRTKYFKNYVCSVNDQKPIPGTSKTDVSKLKVVRKLTFQTPRKQKNARKTKRNTPDNRIESKQNPIITSKADENTAPLNDNNQQIVLLTDESNDSHHKIKSTDREEENIIQQHTDDTSDVYDLTDENNDPNNKLKCTQREEGSIIQKELDIFREIARQHEIEEVCNQIRQDDCNNSTDQYGMDVENLISETITMSSNFDSKKTNEMNMDTLKEENLVDFIDPQELNFIEDNQVSEKEVQNLINGSQDNIFFQNNKKFDLSKTVEIGLNCTEDFKEIDKENEILEEPKNDENIEIISINSEKNEENQIESNNICNIIKNDLAEATVLGKNKMELLLILPEVEKNKNTENDDAVREFYYEPDLNQRQCEIKSDDNSEDSDIINETQMLKEVKRNEYVKKKRISQQKRQKYVDFLFDNEDFVWSSSSWEETGSESSESGAVKKKNKKTKENKKVSILATKSIDDGVSKRKIPKNNKKKEIKQKRETGQEYKTMKGKIIPAKNIKPNPCTPNNCKNKCYEIEENRRKALFSHFWSLDSIRRKDWLISHSKKSAVKRRRSSDLSRRTNTFTYFINEGEGQRRVCQQFLNCTLDIKQKTLFNTVVNSFHGSASEDMRGKHVPSNKTSNLTIENLRKYIEDLPAVPSHYCRKNSKRTYLPQEFRNITNLYRIYKDTQHKNGLQYAGEKVFKKVFTTEFNIGFHCPRKDKCLKCTQYENDKNINEEEKQRHLMDKEETAERFKAHQEIHKKDNTILCTTFDLQKVLNTPHGENMMLYYSRKLAVYNLTFYESGTRNGYCYTWSEIDGKRGANEISSILQKYISEVDQRGTIKHLLLYCDSCPGQNKNKVVLACISESIQNCHNILSIQINYLLPGHTYMPVDSVHSIIEKSLSGVVIWAPSQWSTVFTLARKSPRPYDVEVLTYTDLKKWDTIADKYFKGNLVGKMSKVRTVTFKKSTPNVAFIKFSMNQDAETEQIEIVKKKDAIQLKPCYKGFLPVSKKKYMDLYKLCTSKVIPTVYHAEYKRLNYSNNIQDCLVDTDAEDEKNYE